MSALLCLDTWSGGRIGRCPYCECDHPWLEDVDVDERNRDASPRELVITWWCPDCREIWYTVDEIGDWEVREYEDY